MPTKRTEFAQSAGDDMLIFQWRKPRASSIGKLGILAVAAGVLIVPLSFVNIDLAMQPVQESRSAEVMMLSPGSDPMQWLEVARDLGPFPTRFEPAEWADSKAAVDDVIHHARNLSISRHQPQLLEFPKNEALPIVPLVVKGSSVLPRVATPEFTTIDTGRVTTTPVLYPLSIDRDQMPTNRPPFGREVSSEMAYQPLRFLLEVTPDGIVRSAVALNGHNAPGRESLVDWIQSHRFPAMDLPGARWIAVAITFQNQSTDGVVDP